MVLRAALGRAAILLGNRNQFRIHALGVLLLCLAQSVYADGQLVFGSYLNREFADAALERFWPSDTDAGLRDPRLFPGSSALPTIVVDAFP